MTALEGQGRSDGFLIRMLLALAANRTPYVRARDDAGLTREAWLLATIGSACFGLMNGVVAYHAGNPAMAALLAVAYNGLVCWLSWFVGSLLLAWFAGVVQATGDVTTVRRVIAYGGYAPTPVLVLAAVPAFATTALGVYNLWCLVLTLLASSVALRIPVWKAIVLGILTSVAIGVLTLPLYAGFGLLYAALGGRAA